MVLVRLCLKQNLNWKRGAGRVFYALAAGYILGASLYGWIAWTIVDRVDARLEAAYSRLEERPRFTVEEILYLEKLAAAQHFKPTPVEERLMQRRFDEDQQSIAAERLSRESLAAWNNLMNAAVFGAFALLLAIGIVLAWVIRGFRVRPD